MFLLYPCALSILLQILPSVLMSCFRPYMEPFWGYFNYIYILNCNDLKKHFAS
jgi:hypothetical protein